MTKSELINTYEVTFINKSGNRATEIYRVGGNKQFKKSNMQGVIETHNLLGNKVLGIDLINQDF